MSPQNPYRAGASVGGTDAFIGRTEILNAIKNILDSPDHHALVLYGQRRIGKSSVLTQLEFSLSKANGPIFWDWHEKATWPLKKVLEELAYIISTTLEQPRPTLEPDPEKRFKQWLEELLKTTRLILLFDEFDVIATSQGTKDIIGYLGELLALNTQNLKCIFAIGCKREQLFAHTIEFFRRRNVESRMVSLFSKIETEDLIRLSERNQTLQWSSSAIERIWQLTAGHPYFTQQLCSKIWDDLCMEKPSHIPLVTSDHVQPIVPKVLEATEHILASFWKSLSHPERVVAVILASPQAKWSNSIDRFENIAPLLEKARTSLREWEVIQEEHGHDRFQVEIIRQWIETHKTLYKDLDLIDPHAQAIYNITERLDEEHRLDSAQILLEQAVLLNPYHSQAKRLLAEILEKKQKTEEACEILKSLYDYNQEVAKKPLLEVLWKLVESPGEHKEPKTSSSCFESYLKKMEWWKPTLDAQEAEQLSRCQQILEIDRQHEKAARKKEEIEEQRANRAWKQRIKKILLDGLFSKWVWRITGGMLIFLILLGFSPTLPPDIILEIEKSDEQTYLLKNVPSAGPHHLQSIVVFLEELEGEVNFKEKPKFKYQDQSKELDLEIVLTHPKKYTMDESRLKTELGITSFEYHKENSLLFTFKAKKLKFKECQASNQEGKDVKCQVKEKGYLPISLGIPWWGILIFFVLCWIIGVEMVFIVKSKRKDNDVAY